MPLTISGDTPNFSAATITAGTVTTLNAPSGVLATQNGMTGIAKAWGSYAYTGSTPTLNSAFNISSFTRNSAGNYTIAFTTAMPNTNYSVVGNGVYPPSAQSCIINTLSKGTSSVTILTVYSSATNGNATVFDYGIDFAIFSS